VLYTAGESLVRTAAVKIAMIMCGDAVANKLGIFLLSNHTIKRHIEELSVDILQRTFDTAKRSRNFISELITDLECDCVRAIPCD